MTLAVTCGSPAPGPGPLTEAEVSTVLRHLMDEVNLTRHRAPAVAGDDDDLPAPVGQPNEAFRECAEDIWRSLRTVVTAVT